MEHKIEIDLNRCLCIHSLLQLVDVSLQTILFTRGLIPETFQRLETNTTPKAQQFRDLYAKITEILKSAFRSFNRDILEEVLIIFGNTPFSPLDIFRIDVQPCRLHDDLTELTEEGVKSTCAETCGVLSARDKRKIFMSLACGKDAESINSSPKLGKLAKVFISIRTNGKLMNIIDGLEFDESYEPPEEKEIKQRNVRTIRINSKKCQFDDANLNAVDSTKSSEIWHQLIHVISSL